MLIVLAKNDFDNGTEKSILYVHRSQLNRTPHIALFIIAYPTSTRGATSTPNLSLNTLKSVSNSSS